MAKRVSKKLLLGLGSTLAFGSIAVVAGFGIDSIVSSVNNFNQDQLALNTLPEADFKTATDYNVATSDMFINTTNLKDFHFGNTQKGQTVTPYGWLGVFEDSATIQNRIALTGWNGEILWVNEDYKDATNSDFNVYEMKYDFNTNLIFVLRSSSQNGLVDDNQNSLALANVQLDILDAATGQRIANGGQAINANDFSQFQNRALTAIRQKFLNISNKKSITNLFQLDVVSISSTKVLVTWMPNFMLLKSLTYQTFPGLIDVIDYFDELTKSFVFEKISSSQVNKYTKNLNLRGNGSSEFGSPASSPVWFRPWDNGFPDASDYALLANPFFTITGSDKLILHLILAKSRRIENNGTKTEITHKIVGFSEGNGRHLGFDFDKSEQIGGVQIGNASSYFNLLNIDTELNSNTAAWSRANTFGTDFINANLRINRNMFDGNSVVFAYPYAAQTDKGNNNFPIFNVAQLQIDSATGLLSKNNANNNKKRNTNWDFGKQFVDHYKKNKGNYGQPNVNKVYPYPNMISNNLKKLHHNYHRLISVNPFDNTFIYAGKSNLTDQALEQVDANTSKYASFWISRNDKFLNGKGIARPLIIGNDKSLSNSVDGYMTSISANGFDGLYNDGFTFDPRSLETVNNGQKSLQLYFNQTGTGRNDTYANNGFKTSKIGLLNDILKQASTNDNNGNDLWVDNIANVSKIGSKKNLLITGIDLNSYSTLIHSRANLEKWYPRTFWNNTNPGNNLSGNTNLNESNVNSDIRAIANNFGNRLNGAEFDSQRGVDLVSAWKDRSANSSKNPPNYSRLFVKRPQIKVRNETIENQLPTETTYPLTSTNFLGDWLPKNSTDHFIFKTKQNIANASYEILTTFGKTNNNIVLSNINNATDNIGLTYEASGNQPAAWFDKRKRPQAGTFGSWNNNKIVDNKTPLRLLAKIVKPTGNLPAWFSQIDAKIFNSVYPVDSPTANETTFQQVLTELVKQKASNLEIQGAETAPVGLGNLKIEVYLGLNPNFIANSGNKIYTNGSNNKMIVDSTTGQRVIYNDRYDSNKRTIYDQSQISYSTFKSGGFSSQTVTNSGLWKNGVIKSGQKLLVATNYDLLPDKIVRKTPGNRDPLFQFDYQPGTQNLEISPVDLPWFKSFIQNLNRMLNLYAGLQYKTATNNRWTDHVFKPAESRKFLYDNEWNFTNNKLVLSNFPARDVTKLRIKLWKKDETEIKSDPNHFVKYENLNINPDIDSDDLNPVDKFISVAHNIASQKVIVNKQWFNEVKLTKIDQSKSAFLQDISLSDLQRYENNIFNKSSSITSNSELRKQVILKYKYKFGGDTGEVDAAGLVAKLKSKLADFNTNDQAVWGLWNGQNGVKIQAVFTTVNANSNIQFVNSSGTQLSGNDLVGDIISEIKTKIDLTSLFTQFQSSKISARKGQVGQLLSFELPSKTGAFGSDQFNSLTFAKIENLLNNVGITTQYKKFDVQNKKSSWLNNAQQVNTYYPSDPKIILGFNTTTDWNVELVFNNKPFDSNSELELQLNLPQIVKKNDVDLVNFANSKPIRGNTFKINIDNATLAETNLKNALIKFNNDAINSANAFNNLNLAFKYRLGTSGEFRSAAELKTFLSTLNTTQTNNTLYLKLEIQNTNGKDPEFELEDGLQGEIQLYNDNNETIKKFIHAQEIEKQLDNAVADGDFGNLQITFPKELDKIVKQVDDGYSQALKLQFSLADLATSDNTAANPSGNYRTEWVDIGTNGIPGNILATDFPDPKNKKIYLQIVLRNTHENRYIYGPDDPNETIVKKRGEIDLNTISRKIAVNSIWFSQQSLAPQNNNEIFLENLNLKLITDFENRIWNSAGISNTDPDRSKLTLKYEFNGKDQLDAQSLLNEISNFQKQYDTSHLGILALWNGKNSDNQGTRIKARFATTNPNETTIKFVDAATNQPTSNLTGDINTERIVTKINLSRFIETLITQETTVELKQNQAGTISKFTPPGMPNNRPGEFLNGKNYEQIANRLDQLGITIVFEQPNGANKIWVTKDRVNSYDIKTSLLPFSFENRSSNINLEVGSNNTIPHGDVSHQAVFNLRLNAPKQISILNDDLTDFLQTRPFTGNTKILKFDENPTKIMIKKILDRNAQINSDFANAPLEIVFKLSNLPYMKGSELVNFLKNKPDDVPGRDIKFKFQIPPDQANQWLIDPANMEYQLYSENDQNPLTIFVNDQELFNNLKRTTLSGTNENLIWNFVENIQVNPTTGAITWNNPVRAHGLKLQYTFNPNANVNDRKVAKAANQGWVDEQPSNFDPNQEALFIRIQPMDSKFTYEKIYDKTNEKIRLPLDQIRTLIELDGNWLNQIFVNANINISQISLDQFNVYEALVYAEMDKYLNSANKAKVAIVYDFDGETDLPKDFLVEKIKTYPENNEDFGWLQLWNGFQGKKIKAKFIKANPNGNYEFNYKDPNKIDQILDTKTIKTVVDLKPLVSWLELTQVQIKAGATPNSITELIFSPISAGNSPFNNKTWELSSTVLANLGLKIEYQKIDGKPNNPWGDRNSIDAYDGRGKFNIRFVLEKDKGNNIVAQVRNNEQIENPEKVDQPSQEIAVNLKVAKQIIIKKQFVDEFIKTKDVIRGNTKRLEILEEAENKLIDQIKKDNEQSNPGTQPSFNSAPLTVLYSIGQDPNAIPEGQWLTRQAFIDALMRNNNDQSSNQINFKFIINTPNGQDPQFVVDPTTSQLNNHEEPTNGTRIAYYINLNQWENYANNVNVTGTNSALTWRWNQLNVVSEKGLSLVSLTTGLKGLRIEFTTKNNARYDDPDGKPNADIQTNWTTTLPTSIVPNSPGLFIRLKAQPGFVYQAQENNTGSVHSVDLQIKFQISVDTNWILKNALESNDGFLNTLTTANLESFSKAVLDNIQQADLRSKVELVFQFNETGNWLSSLNLMNQILTYSQNYTDANSDYGLLQLFNGTSGIKIKALFRIKQETGNEKYELINTTNNSTAEADLNALVNTTNIKTLINLKVWINHIKSIKIDFDPLANQINSISKIKPPAFPGALGDGPLNGLTFEQLETLLSKHNIIMEWRAIKPNQGSEDGWGPRNQLNSYDPNNPKIQLRFKANNVNAAANLVLSIENDKDFNANTNRPSQAITLTLKAAAQIKIDPNFVQEFITNPDRATGDTKNLVLDRNAEKKLIDQIKKQNEADSPNLGFIAAPLIVEYKLGDNSNNWLKLDAFIKSLEISNEDQQTNKIFFRFNLENQDLDNPDFSVDTSSRILSDHQNPNDKDLRIKYYINRASWEADADNISVSGSNERLNWNYGSWNIQKNNQQTLIQLPNGLNGLQIQYTTQNQPNYDDTNVGNNIDQEWVNLEPGSINPSTQKLTIRLIAATGFVYQDQKDGKAKIHNISLSNLKFTIPVNLDWIKNTTLTLASGEFVNELTKQDLDSWSQNVLNNLDSNLRDKIKLEFTFNNQKNLNTQQLYEAIQNYLKSYNQAPNFGLLQLWNEILGLQIKATFSPLGPDSQYIPVINNSNQPDDLTAVIKTSHIKTLINLQPLINFLKNPQNKITFIPGPAENSIQTLNMPNFPGNLGSGPLAGLSFNQLETLFENHGIIFEWRSVNENNTDSDWKPRNQLTSYDPGFGQIELRLNVQKNQPDAAQNLVFSIESNKDYQPINKKPSQAIKFNLQVPKKITLDQALIDKFKNTANVVGGDTKFLTIDDQAEKELIKQILQANADAKPDVVPSYTTAKLVVLYSIGDLSKPNQLKWFKREQFLKELENEPKDQTTNQINFKFDVENINPDLPDFTVAPKIDVLSPHKEANAADLKIKYYINDAQWEQHAATVFVSGSNNNLKWNWGNLQSNIQENGQQVLVGRGLRLEFSAKPDAKYEDLVNENINGDLTREWITKKPTKIPVDVTNLWIRLKPQIGFVYGPENKNTATVKAIGLDKLVTQLIVNKEWIENTDFAGQIQFVEQINETHINQFIKNVINNYQPAHLQNKISLRFNFNNSNNLNATELFQAIQSYLQNTTNNTKGLLKLFDSKSQTGIKIDAYFVSLDSKFEVVDQNLQSDPNNLKATVNTDQINTNIDLQKYVQHLIQNPLKVQVGKNEGELDQIFLPNFDATTSPSNFNGLDWNAASKILDQLGIKLQAAAFLDVNFVPTENDWKDWNSVKQYKPEIGKIKFRFKIMKSSNIVLSILNEHDVNFGNQQNVLVSDAFDVSLAVPLKITVNQYQIEDFIKKSQIRGNTKFLTIAEQPENDFIDAIIKSNSAVNNIFNQARDRIKIKYALGQNVNTASDWKDRETFINFLKNQNSDQTTNQINFALFVENPDGTNEIFAIDPHINTIIQHQINKNATVLIYVHERGLERLASQMAIQGTNNNFIYLNVPGFVIGDDSNINNIPGLKLQYSTKRDIDNMNYDNATAETMDPSKGWTNKKVTQIDPNERFLAVQIVALDGYIYGADYAKQHPNEDNSSKWKVHPVNVDQIVSEIRLSNQGLKQIAFIATLPDLAVDKIKILEIAAKNAANFESQGLKDKVKIEYQLEWKNTIINWTNIDELQRKVQELMNNFNNDNLGLLKFNSSQTTLFASIKARFTSIDSQYVVVDKDNPNNGTQSAANGLIVKTDQLVTPVDLKSYVKILETKFISLPQGATNSNISGFSPPDAPAANNDQFAGHSFAEISQALKLIGIKVEFLAPDSQTTKNNWVLINEIVDLNSKNDLFLRFALDENNLSAADLEVWKNSFNISTKNPDDGWNWKPTGQNDLTIATAPIKLRVDLPILLNTDKNLLKAELENQFEGTTAELTSATVQNISAKVTKLIQETLANNNTTGTDVSGAPLKIEFSLGREVLTQSGQKIWFEIQEFANALKANKTNWNINEIEARWFIDQNAIDVQNQRYQISDPDAIIVQKQNNQIGAPLKMFIHAQNAYSDANTVRQTLKVKGNNQNYVINNLTQWISIVPQGLELFFSNYANPNLNSDSDWSNYTLNQELPKPLNANGDLRLRFKVKSGYLYENANKQNPLYSDPVILDTSNLQIVLALETVWLENIKLDGNLKDLKINEIEARKMMVASGQLPTDQDQLIQFEYSINGQKWFSKNDFESYLQTLAGKKNDDNFILRREELMVRFKLEGGSGKYQMQINGVLIDPDGEVPKEFNVGLIDDQNKRNDNVTGYINMTHLPLFNADNFAIQGSTSQPILIIKNRDKLNNLLSIYASDNLFTVEFSTDFDPTTGLWQWPANQQLWKNGQLVGDKELINQGIQIRPEGYFALRFRAIDPKYEVYDQEGTQQDHDQGYIINASDNVKITIEIENPFTKMQKTLGVWTRENNNRPHYQQGKGGFKIVVAEDDWTINSNPIQSAQEFLETSTNLTSVEKEALEFVYHIFPNQPSESDVNELKSKITNYQDLSWKTFSSDSDDWSDDLGLKVGDYVSVALRVKESYANKTDGAFVLKDDDYSMLTPIINDKEPGRVAGYEINVDAISIQESNVGLFNNEDSTLPPIDGYTSLAKISLDKDEEGQYLGVDLDLQVYSEFYLNQNNGILVAPVSKQRLVKRDPSEPGITIKGNYKDESGGDLKDKEGKTIPILKDANNRLAKPIKGQERTQALDNLDSGEFKLPPGLTAEQNEKLSFFRNQDIDVKLKGRVGKGTEKLPDYYANKERTIQLKDLISPRIKFTVDNDNNVKYEWPQEEFNPGQIQYQNSDNTPGAAKDGKAEVITVLKIKRWENNNESIITDIDINDALKKINEMLNNDFGGQLRFETIYQQATGNTSTFEDNNIYRLKNLKNRDRITVRIVATDDDLYYTGEPNPLVINVNGLVESAPKEEQLQYLRVEQSGQVEGKGSFRVLATDPNIPGQTNEQVLAGWKFMLRVWDKNKEIKIEWTDDQSRINNLENGDKIEWKLVSADGNPVDKAYYNTVAQNHEYDENNQIKYNFAKVNYPKGEASKQVVESNIGQYPTTDQYPEDSGYMIAGLKPVPELFKISSDNLAKIFKVLNPTYVGLNHQGAINFDNQYLNNNYYVNIDGEVYQKQPTDNNLLVDDSDNNTNELFEISVKQLLENVTFYNQDPILNPYQNGFKFSDNTVNINNHLSNGDQIWAQFSVVQTNSATSLNSGITIKLNTVSGLKNTSDPMSPFWYVLMALAGIATLGVSAIAAFLISRHKKLKGKN